MFALAIFKYIDFQINFLEGNGCTSSSIVSFSKYMVDVTRPFTQALSIHQSSLIKEVGNPSGKIAPSSQERNSDDRGQRSKGRSPIISDLKPWSHTLTSLITRMTHWFTINRMQGQKFRAPNYSPKRYPKNRLCSLEKNTSFTYLNHPSPKGVATSKSFLIINE